MFEIVRGKLQVSMNVVTITMYSNAGGVGTPETDLLIAQLKEKINDVNLISSTIRRRLETEG